MLSCQRDLFSLDPTVHYLNCAYMSPLPIRVEEAGISAFRSKQNPHLVSTSDFFLTVERVRRLFATLIGAANPSSISLIPAVSYGIATAAKNITCQPGQNIVLVHEQFPSNVYSWMSLAKEKHLSIRTALPEPNAPDASAALTDAVLALIDQNTIVVALPTVHWTNGTKINLQAIGERSRAVGAYFILDGTQSVGALPIDVASLKPDALIVAGYKWMMGPYSCGLAYWSDRFLGGSPLEENWINRLDSENFAGLVDYQNHYQPGAIRYDVGEKSNFFLLPMLEEALTMLLEWQPERVQEYVAALVQPWEQSIRELGYIMADEQSRGAHLFGIQLPAHLSPNRIKSMLDSQQVSVSVRGKSIRVAPHVYNSSDNMAAFVDALRLAAHT